LLTFILDLFATKTRPPTPSPSHLMTSQCIAKRRLVAVLVAKPERRDLQGRCLRQTPGCHQADAGLSTRGWCCLRRRWAVFTGSGVVFADAGLSSGGWCCLLRHWAVVTGV